MDLIQTIEIELPKLHYDQCRAILSTVESIMHQKHLQLIAEADAADLASAEDAWEKFLVSGKESIPHEIVMQKLKAICDL